MVGTSRYSTATEMLLAQASVEREARRARRALWIERALRALWPVWALVALFLGLALLGVPAALPSAWHAALLAAFGAATLFFLARGLWSLRRPSPGEALARLDEGARGRPAQTYSDALVAGSGDKGTEAIWRAHQRLLAGRAAALRARAPDFRVSERDPYALRHGGLIALAAGLIAFFGTEGAVGARLADQLNPGALNAGPAAPAPTLEAWATPPAYTGVTAIYLTRLIGDSPVKLPAGTEISLRVFDTGQPPVLEATTGDGETFADKGAGVYDAVFRMKDDGVIRVMEGEREMGAWSVQAIPDAPPIIAFKGAPKAGERGALELAYSARDDYGVQAAEATITLDEAAAREGIAARSGGATVYDPITLDLPLPLTGANREVEETLIEDLAAHPWAGSPVVYTIIARDAAGQEGVAEMRALLPARRFHHPMAKALIEQRRALALSTATAPRVYDVLEAVMMYPEEVFDDDTAFLVARVAVRRLEIALEDGRLEEETKSIVDLLWKAAVRLEDGDLSSAAERLARAQEKLKDAIENGASEEELARLMEELRQAMRDYMAEMMKEALRDQANGQPQQPPQGDQQTMTMNDIEKMLQELEEAIRNGQQELARQMMQALQQMMQNLQMAQPGQGQPGQGEQMMNELGDMIGEQQGLADRSFDQMREGEGQRPGEGQGEGDGQHRNQGHGEGRGEGLGQGEGGGDSAGQIARDQEALRQLLDQLRSGLPGAVGEETRRALEEADRAMGDAVDALEGGDERQAVDDQVRALDQLREGRREMGRDLAEAEGRGDGDQAGRDGRGRDSNREDPLGRPRATDGPLDGDSVRVPGATLGKRARELQEEIRRRAGERSRPPEELDYLDRLLERF